uniref:Structural glycoprotein gpUL73 n=1 Tax=Human cytomegalovirus TaxID=10359 RepID=Q8JUG1_HCMV|nr:structural glycoprotein gpUL73 [Human betaherpesvirus 5]
MEWNTLVLGLLVLSVVAESSGNNSSTSTSATTSKSSASVSTTKLTKLSSTTHDPNVMRRHANDDFYKAHCTSHMYELSLSSFAAWWTMLNALILMGAFCIVLRHCCFQNFTATTTKSY